MGLPAGRYSTRGRDVNYLAADSGYRRQLSLLSAILAASIANQFVPVAAAACQNDWCRGVIACQYGQAFDTEGCVLCSCLQPCQTVNCGDSQICEPVQVPGCDGKTCQKYVGECRDGQIATCPPVDCSSMTCQFGFKYNSDGCQTCNCRDPCEGYPCPSGQRCKMTPDDCPPDAELCRDGPMPHCVNDVMTSTTQAPAITSSTTVQSSERQQSTTSRVQCGPDPCLGLICLYGRAVDAAGCVMCDCQRPCEDVTCDAGQQCKPVLDASCADANCRRYVGQCVVVPTCPPVDCSSMTCQFGFKYDSAGCQTCNCRDLCEGYLCPSGQRCKMTPDDCPPDSELCRDGPMPHCVNADKSPSTSTATSTITTTASTTTTTLPTTTTPSTPVPTLTTLVPTTIKSSTPIPTTTTPSTPLPTSKTPTPVPTTRATPSTWLPTEHPVVKCPDVICDDGPCQFGRVLDMSGCWLCECRPNPCETMLCPPEQTCKLAIDDCPYSDSSFEFCQNSLTMTPFCDSGHPMAEAVLRIDADYSIIENATDFRSQMQTQIGSLLDVSKKEVVISKLTRGSILVHFHVDSMSGVNSHDMRNVFSKMTDDDFTVMYNERPLMATIVNYTISDEHNRQSTPAVSSNCCTNYHLRRWSCTCHCTHLCRHWLCQDEDGKTRTSRPTIKQGMVCGDRKWLQRIRKRRMHNGGARSGQAEFCEN